MNEQRNAYGFPVLERAQAVTAEVRSRNFPVPCQCATCLAVENFPAVQRILAKLTPMDRSMP